MFRIYTFIILSALFISCSNNTVLKEIKTLPSYPSASGIEFLNNKIYIIGDDAKNILVLDSNLTVIDSITLYNFAERKIPKAIKPDLEAMIRLQNDQLLLLGSGSLSPYRNLAWLINPATKQADSIRLDAFYDRLRANGIKDLNIEGGCNIPGSIILSNRGNKGFTKNHLVFTSPKFWTDQLQVPVTVIRIGGNTDSTSFQGVSGLTYSAKTDQLILTISTEDTKNSMDDGAIGKSYLWIVNNISSKKRWTAINPNKIIDLEETDQRFKGQKIESVCITKETRNFLHLVLAADNDNGSSTLFKMIVEK